MSNSQQYNLTTPDLSSRLVYMLAISCGICAGSNYFNQPLIYSIAQSLNTTVEATALVIVIGQVSYAVGLFALVPLGDFFEKRRYIVLLMTCTGLSQIALAFCHNIIGLYGFTFLATFFSVATQVLVPFAAGLASPSQSPHVVGKLMSGLFLGILLARAVAGLYSTIWSWHAVYFTSGILIIACACIIWRQLPRYLPQQPIRIGEIYPSLFSLAFNQPHLIRRGLVGGIGFGLLALIFTTMTFILANAPYYFNDFQIGVFGIVGLAGVFATPWAGKKIAKHQENKTAKISLILLIIAWVPLYFAQQGLIQYFIGVVLAYFGLSALHVLNQNLIYRISLQARSRINSIYMTLYFAGATFGSTIAIYMWKHYDWHMCVRVAFVLALICFVIDRYDFYCLKQKLNHHQYP